MNNESAFINCAEVQTSPKVCTTLLYFTSMWKEFKEKKEIHIKRMFVSQWNWSSDSLDQSHVRSSIWMTAIFFLFMLSRRPSGWNVSMWVDMAKWSGAIVTFCPQNLSQSRGEVHPFQEQHYFTCQQTYFICGCAGWPFRQWLVPVFFLSFLLLQIHFTPAAVLASHNPLPLTPSPTFSKRVSQTWSLCYCIIDRKVHCRHTLLC